MPSLRHLRATTLVCMLGVSMTIAACGDDAHRSSGTATPAATATAVATASSTGAPPATLTSTALVPPTLTATAQPTMTVTRPPTATATAASTVTATPDVAVEARYVVPGPYPVGYTTLALPDRLVAVFYPALPGSEAGKSPATYDQKDPLPQFLKDLLGGQNLTFEMTAYADLPGASGGPFPLVLFSHGFGGWRLVNSRLLAGIASWGFVVAAPDHLDGGLAAIATNTAHEDLATDIRVLLATRDLVGAPTGTAAATLAGLADLDRTAVTGHSAGGGAALAMLNDPNVNAVVGYAAAGEPAAVAHGKPALLIGAAGDLVVPPTVNAMLYDELLPPRRAVVIDRTGHNSFTDSCIAIRSGVDLVGIVRMLGLPIPDDLLLLATNGCEAENLDPALALTVIQHFTVAHLRAAFAIDPPPVGLGAGVVNAFPGVTVTYTFED